MKNFGIKFRYINAQCYEFVLPGGKHMLIDPYITPTRGLGVHGLRDFSAEEVEGADYILLTHSHYDHTSDLGILSQKFNSDVFVGDMAAFELAKFYDLNLARIYPMTHGQTFEMNDFTLTCYRGKHFGGNVHLERVLTMTKDLQGVENYGHIDALGYVETFDFCLTFRNNLRLMFVSGNPTMNNAYTIADQFRPNVVIRHVYGKWPPKEYATILDRFHAQLAMPCHQDGLIGGKKYDIPYSAYMEQTKNALREMHSQTQLIDPTPYQWYEVSVGVEEGE